MTGKAKVRESTDESLRVERDHADTAVDSRLEKVEGKTDEAVRVSREVDDSATQTARDEADSGAPRTEREAGEVGAARDRADVEVERQRLAADAATATERQERKRYMVAFLALERDRTDGDLVEERTLADTLIASRDEFLATVSHDLRTLMGGLSLTADLIAQAAPAGDAGALLRKLAGGTSRYVARMNRLVNDLQDIASIEAGKLKVVLGRVAVDKLLQDTVEAFEPVASSRKIALRADPPPDQLHARLDDERTLQVLANLVSNAIKFTPEGGTVLIAVSSSPQGVHFTVKDSGVGIPVGQLERVFDRYRQVSKDRRGLGLGLHISKCIVEAHGGRIWAESELGVGSAIHFVLPA